MKPPHPAYQTIATPTPGLQESLSSAGTFVERNDIDGWVEAIRILDDPAVYQTKSDAALRRSADLDPEPYIDLFEREMCAVAVRWQHRY